MNQVPIKLGPLALLLTIISICLTTLSILTFTTAGADLRLADKYAETVRIRYDLEREGQTFLQEADETVSSGLPLNAIFDAAPAPGGGITKTFEQDGTVLTVTLVPDPGAGGNAKIAEAGTAGTGSSTPAERIPGVRISEWKIVRQWQEDDSIGNIWDGEW